MRWNRLRIISAVMSVCGHYVMFPLNGTAPNWYRFQECQQIISILMNILHSVKYQIVFT